MKTQKEGVPVLERKNFLRLLYSTVLILILLSLILTVTTPVSAADIQVACVLTDNAPGKLVRCLLKAYLSTDLDPDDWIVINFPCTQWDLTVESVQYADRSGIHTLAIGYREPEAGSQMDFSSRVITRYGGSTVPAGTTLTITLCNVRTPSSGGIYNFIVTTREAGSFTQFQTTYGALKDTGAAVVRVGQYAYSTSGADSAAGIYGPNLAAQTFTPTIDHRVSSFMLKLYRKGNPGLLAVSVRETNSLGHPSGPALCSGTLDAGTITTNIAGEWYAVYLDNAPYLYTDKKYAIVAELPDGNTLDQVWWKMASKGASTGGDWERSSNSGTFWSSSIISDLLFEEYGSPPHSLSIEVSGYQGGTVTRDPDQFFYDDGQTVTLTANPYQGWHLAGWQVAGVPMELPATGQTLTLTMDASKEITVRFAINTYLLQLLQEGQGTVTCTPGPDPATGRYYYGTQVQLEAVEDQGYWFQGWQLGPGQTVTDHLLTLTMDQPWIVAAIFSSTPYLDLSVSGNGTIEMLTEAGYTECSGGRYAPGTILNLRAVANTGSRLDHWEYSCWQDGVWVPDQTSTDPGSLIVTVDKLTQVTAVFSDMYHLTVTQEGEGTVSPGNSDYTYGSIVPFSITPANGWVLESISGLDYNYDDKNDCAYIYGDHQVHVVFIRDEINFAITAEHGAVSLNPPSGPYTRTGTPYIYLTATPDTGWKLDHWEYAVPIYWGRFPGEFSTLQFYADDTSTSNPLELDFVAADGDHLSYGTVEVTACFVQDTSYSNTLSVAGGENGTVAVSPAQANYADGSAVTITATPDPGYRFVNWSGDIDTIADIDAASTTITMNGSYSIQANFANDPPAISDIGDQTINEDVSISSLNFTIGDIETSSANLILSGLSGNIALVPPSNITFSGSETERTVSIIPNANRSGTSTITITVMDGAGATISDTFTVTVNPVNDVPRGTDKTVTTLEDTGYIFTPADFGFSDPLDSPANLFVAVKITTLPGAGILFHKEAAVTDGQYIPAPDIAAGYLRLIPELGASGTAYASLTFQVQDDGGTDNGGVDLDQSANTLTINVTEVNDAPTISNIIDQIINVEGASTSSIPFTVADAETAAEELTVTGSSSNTTLVPAENIVLGGSTADRTVTITPAAGYTGTAVITVTVSDGSLSSSDIFILTVPVIPAGDRQIDQAQETAGGESTFQYNELAQTFTAGISGRLDYVSVLMQYPEAATLMAQIQTVNSEGEPSGTVLASTSVNVTANEAEHWLDIWFSPAPLVNSGTKYALVLNASGESGITWADYTLSDIYPGGQAFYNSSGWTARPDADFTFRTFVRETVNQAPIANPDAAEGEEDCSPIQINVLANDTDPDSDVIRVTAVSEPANGSVTFSDTSIFYTPDPDYNGPDSFNYTISDSIGGTSSATVNITIAPINDPPIISTVIPDQYIASNTSTGAISFTIEDIDSPPDSLELIGTTTDETVVPAANIIFGGSGANRTVTVTPAADLPAGSNASIKIMVFEGADFVETDSNYITFSVGITYPSTLDVAPVNGIYGGQVTLSATLSPALSGMPIDFTLNGIPAGSALTNSDGTASLNSISLSGIDSGTYSNAVEAHFAGYLYSGPSQGKASLTVDKATATITLTGLNRTYDGSAKYARAATTPAGLNVTLSYTRDNLPVISPVQAGSYTVMATINDTNYQGSTTGTLIIDKADSSVIYTGPQTVIVPEVLTLSAALTGPGLLSGMIIEFTLDVNPVTGDSERYSLGITLTDSSGEAVLTISTTGWSGNIAIIMVSLTGDSNLQDSSDESTLNIAEPGTAAMGAGWYTLNGSGRVNFAFNVKKVEGTENTYKGKFLLMNVGNWQLKGELNQLGVADRIGISTGTGTLYLWDPANLTWDEARPNVAFTITFADNNTGAAGSLKKSGTPDQFGVSMDYWPDITQPELPDSEPQALKGGNISMADISSSGDTGNYGGKNK